MMFTPKTVLKLANEGFDGHFSDCTYLGEGCDFVCFLCDGEWVLRFPGHEQADAMLVSERETLSRVHKLSLPVPIPEFEYFSAGVEAFDRPFAGYRYLPGTPLSEADDRTLDLVFPQLGEFLQVLHSAPVEPRIENPNAEFYEDTEWAANQFGETAHLYPRDLRDLMADVVSMPWPADPEVPEVLAHADFSEDHILFDPKTSKITGVIDWADAFTAIRTLDFGDISQLGAKAGIDSAYATYGATPTHDERIFLQHQGIVKWIEVIYDHIKEDETALLDVAFNRLRKHFV